MSGRGTLECLLAGVLKSEVESPCRVQSLGMTPITEENFYNSKENGGTTPFEHPFESYRRKRLSRIWQLRRRSFTHFELERVDGEVGAGSGTFDRNALFHHHNVRNGK